MYLTFFTPQAARWDVLSFRALLLLLTFSAMFYSFKRLTYSLNIRPRCS